MSHILTLMTVLKEMKFSFKFGYYMNMYHVLLEQNKIV